MLNILWFRRDLRVSDHVPLLMAVSDGLVAPLVVVEPEYWAQPYASARQWRFAARAITALRSQLAVIGAPLIVRTSDAIEAIASLQEKSMDVAIWSHDTVGSAWEAERDEKIADWATQAGIPWHKLPDTGGPDRDRPDPWSGVLADQPSPPPDLMIAHGVVPGRVVSERILYLDEDPCADLPAGPAGARRVLDRFMDAAEAETAGTAEVEEALAGLAPHFAWGTLSAREAWHELERLKPDAEKIACQLQDRITESLAPADPGAVKYSTTVPDIETIESAIRENPLLTAALGNLRDHGVIRGDLLALLAHEAAVAHSIAPQRVLDALAPLRTGYVEVRGSMSSLPSPPAGDIDPGSLLDQDAVLT